MGAQEVWRDTRGSEQRIILLYMEKEVKTTKQGQDFLYMRENIGRWDSKVS